MHNFRSLQQSLIAFVLVTFTCSTVFAAGRYKRAATKVNIKVKQTELTRKVRRKKQKAAPPKNITPDTFFKVQGAVQNIRDEQIELLQEMIEDTPDSDADKPDLYFRLAELIAQKQRYYHFMAMELYAKIDRAKNRATKSRLKRAQANYFKREKRWLLEAVKVYSGLANKRRFRNYKRMHEALFFLAYTLQQAKREDAARKVFLKLIKDHPGSRFVPHAYLAFAEHKFKENELATAAVMYDKVLQFPKVSIYDYALYMKGWVRYNQARFGDSMKAWLKVVQRTKNNRREQTMNRAAKKDFVRAYSEVGNPEKAYKAFKRVDKKYAFKMLGFLGEYYLSQGKATETIYTFRQMIKLRPKDKEVCGWQFTIVQATRTRGSRLAKVKEIENLIKLYKYLENGKKIPKNALAECEGNARGTTGELAKIWHVEAMKTLDFETLAFVHKLYRLYMDNFPEADDVDEMQYYFAELLWRRAEEEKKPSKASILWEQAANEYNKVVEGGHATKKILKEAAFATVLAWKNALDVDPTSDRAKVDADKEYDAAKIKRIPEKERKMIAAFDVYIRYITDPGDDELIQMKFFKARIYWKYADYKRAIPLFIDIINKHSEKEFAEFAANLLLDSLARTNQHRRLTRWVDKLLKNKRFIEDKEEMQQLLALLKRQTMRKLAEKLEKGNDPKACADQYIKIYRTYADDAENAADMPDILFNAAVCYEKADLLGQAIFWRGKLVARYTKHSRAKQSLYAIGYNFSQIARYQEAAAKYEQYAKRFPGEKKAADAINDAIFFRKGIGDDKDAIELTEYYIKKWGKRKKNAKIAAEAHFSLVDIYEKRGDRDKVVRHLRDYLKRWGKKGGVSRRVVAHAKIAQIMWEDSCPAKSVRKGACLTMKRVRALKTKRRKKKKRSGAVTRTQCGPETKNKIVLHDRNRKLVKEAKKHMAAVKKLWNKGKGIKKVGGKDTASKAHQVREMAYWAAATNFYQGEELYEDFLDIRFPDKLNFDPRKKKAVKDSNKRLLKWKGTKEKALISADKVYANVIKEFGIGAQDWAIAAAARRGQLFQNYSDAYFTASIPKNVRTGKYAMDKTDAYCDRLDELAIPLEKKSLGAFSFCLDESSKRNWFNRWSRLCEAELGQIHPDLFPTASEIRADPSNTVPLIDSQSIVQEIEVADDDTGV